MTAQLISETATPLGPEVCRPARIGLVADFAEERWFSMDLVADMLHERLGAFDDIAATLFRPPARRFFSHAGVPAPPRQAWNADRLLNRFIAYPAWLKRRVPGFDLFHIVDHSYAHLALHLPAGKTVVTCHDADAYRCLTNPAAEPRPWWFRAMARRILAGLRAAAAVVCDTRAVQDEIVSLGLVKPEKTCVVYNGVHPACRADACEEADRKAAALLGESGPATDILHVGSVIPRKRIDVLLRVFAELRRQRPDVRLIRAGGRFNGAQERMIRELNIGSAILVLPFLEPEVLAAVYRRAALVLQPSEAEGFGLPVIEAMACGAAVLASDIAVLREVGGAAAEYCPVADVNAWTQGALRLLGERERSPRQWIQRRAAAAVRASQFTWSEYALQLSEIYRGILGLTNGD